MKQTVNKYKRLILKRDLKKLLRMGKISDVSFQRCVDVMHNNMTLAEVAERDGVSKGSVYQTIRRAIEQSRSL